MNLEISPREASKLLDEKDTIILDVRTQIEVEISHLKNFLHIPLQEIPTQINKILKNKTILVLCHHGHRSLIATNYLKKMGFNALSIKGGIECWNKEVNDKIPRYQRFPDGTCKLF